MLLPTKTEVARHLRYYRAWERLLVTHPADRSIRMRFEDTAYTLCVLMGECQAGAAADAAEQFLRHGTAPLRPGPVTRVRDPRP